MRSTRDASRQSLVLLGAAALIALFILALLSSPREAHSANSVGLSGYAWSDGIGWISMTGTNYGLTLDSSGTVSGYAWSDNVGWISANSNDIAACASGATSRISGATWSGWLRVIGANAQDWNGCISMSGSGYGVSYTSSSGAFSGYAWGDKNLGWVDFSRVSTAGGSCTNLIGDNTCNGNSIQEHDVQGNLCTVSTCSYQCSNGACVAPPQATPDLPNPNGGTNVALSVVPSIVPVGKTVTVEWGITNVKGSCSIVGTNGDSWSSSVGDDTSASGTRTSSAIEKQTIYTITCTGLDDATYTESHAVNIIPQFREI